MSVLDTHFINSDRVCHTAQTVYTGNVTETSRARHGHLEGSQDQNNMPKQSMTIILLK